MRRIPNPGQILGIRIRLHYTWPIAFLLITPIVITQFSEAYPLWQRMLLGIAASLLFFAAISIREIVLSSIAISRGIPVKSVTLFVFGGGVSLIAKETTLPIVEVLVAAAGLLSNLVISGLFYGIYILLLSLGDVLIAGLSQWLAFIFFILTLFHFIPASPLDGGRLVRALIWKATDNYDQATHITNWTGRGVGFLLVCGGITLLIVTHQWFVGLVLTFVGWVLQSAAAQSHHHAALREALQDFNARDVMAKERPLITEELSIMQLVRDCILITGQRSFVVGDSGKLRGIVTMRNIKRIPKRRWRSTRIGEIMTPASKLKTAHVEQPASSLLQQMDELGVSEIPVMEKDKVIGVVYRDSLIRLARTRAELGM